MTRSMIEANQEIFKKLRASVAEDMQHRLDQIEKQHIATERTDKDWLQNLKIHGNYRVSGICVVSLLEFRNIFYITFPHDEQFSPASLSEGTTFPVNAGLATALWASPEYRPLKDRNSSGRVVEVIGSTQKCQWRDVARLFPPLCMYRLTSTTFPSKKNAPLRTYCEYLLASCYDLTLPYSEKTMKVLRSLLAGNAGVIGSSAILRALLASNWSHAYLDLFRLIEHLYSAPFLNDLVSDLGIQTQRPVHSIRGIVERALAWKPKEANALDRLFAQIPAEANIFQDLSGVLRVPQDRGKVAAHIYNIRNEIAHFRDSANDRNDEDWDLLLGALAAVVQTLYDECFYDYCSDRDAQ